MILGPLICLFTCFTCCISIKVCKVEELYKYLVDESTKSELNEIKVSVQDVSNLYDDLGSVIDSFLSPRPWWYVIEEPYFWSKSKLLRMRRFDDEYLPIFHQIASVQFPQPEHCHTKKLLISSQNGMDSLGHTFSFWEGSSYYGDWSIILPYIVDPHSSAIQYVNNSFCKDYINKFECIFLPMTSCPVPKLVIEASFNSSIKIPPYFDGAYNEAREITQNEFITHNNEMQSIHKNTLEDITTPLQSRMKQLVYYRYQRHALFHTHFTSLPSLPPQQTETSSTDSDQVSIPLMRHKYVFMDQIRRLYFTYGTIFRLNYNFRSMVQHSIHRFQAEHSHLDPLPTDGNCVVAHVRRGDRVPKGYYKDNVTYWCYTHTYFAGNETCYNMESWVQLPIEDCDQFLDYGCHTPHPYGTITVQEILEIATLLNNQTNHVLLVTDDYPYVQHAMKRIHDHRNVHIFGAPLNHRHKSTYNGVHYLASLALLTQCNAFIGHSDSAVTTMALRLLCIRHSTNVYGKCPIFYDFAYNGER